MSATLKELVAVCAVSAACLTSALCLGCASANHVAKPALAPAAASYPTVAWYVASPSKTDACPNPVTLADAKQVMWIGATPLCTQQSIVHVRCLQMEGSSNEVLTAELDAPAKQALARATPPAGGLLLVSMVAGQKPIAVQTIPNAAGVVLASNAAAPLNDATQWDHLKASFGVQAAVARR